MLDLRPSLELIPGDHACCLYSTEDEHRRVFTEFIRRGLERNERALYAYDTHDRDTILSYLRDVGIAPEPYLESGQLVLLDAAELYVPGGEFDAERNLAAFAVAEQDALAAGFAGLCVTAETKWASECHAHLHALNQYESAVNAHAPSLKAYFVCQYDTRCFPSHHLLLEMANHPLIIAGSELCRNFLYVTPEELTTQDAPTATLNRWLDNLVTHRDTEKALRDERSFHEAVLDSANTFIIVLDRDGRIVDTNQTSAESSGYSLEEIRGEHIWDVFATPEDRAFGPAHLADILDGRAGRRRRSPFVTKAGARCMADLSESVLRDAAGAVEYVVVTGVDITDQISAEGLLRIERDLGLALGAAGDIHDVLSSCLAAIAFAGLDCGAIYSVSQPEGNVELVVQAGLSPEFIAAVSHYDADTANAQIVLAGEPVYFGTDNPYPLGDVQTEGLTALAVIPIKHEGQVIACLNAASRTAHAVPEVARHALQSIAAHIGAAIARLEAEDAVRQSRADLQALFDTMDDMVSICDMEGRILRVNNAACELLGYSHEEFARLTVLGLHRREDRAQALATFADILAGDADRCELPLVTKDGTPIIVETRVSLGSWGDQQVVFGITRDISARRQMEDDLRENERRLGSLLHSATDAITVIDLTGRILEMNDAGRTALCYAPEDVLNQHCANLFAPEDAARLPHEIAMALDLGFHSTEMVVVTKHGRRIPMEINARLIEYKGAPAILSSARDITERRRRDAQRDAMIAGLQAIVEGTDALITAPDLDTLFLRAVEFARERLGLERCAIYATDGTALRGTYGTDVQGRTVDEHASSFDLAAEDWARLDALAVAGKRWLIIEGPLYSWDGEKGVVCATGQNAVTPIRLRTDSAPLGLLFNDNAITGIPLDEAAEEVVAVFCSLLAGIIEQQRSEMALRAHAGVMQAVAHAADTFLRSGFTDDSLSEVLARLGEAAGVGRVAVFKNDTTPDGQVYCGLRHMWIAPGGPPVPDPLNLDFVPYDSPLLDLAHDALAHGQALCADVADWPPEGRVLMEAFGVVSTAAFPVFVEDEWWGFVGFYDCEKSHGWTELEMSALALAAGMLGAGLQRRRAEQEIIDSRETAWTLLNATGDMAVMVEADFTVIAINDEMSRRLGKPPQELVGTSLVPSIPAARANGRTERMHEAVRTGRAVRFEDERLGRHFSNSVYPIFGADGAVTKLAIFVKDITDSKQHEQMQRLSAVGQLAAGVAHEFNNLLAAMMMGAEIASLDRDETSYQHLAEVVIRSTERGADICRNLTAFARPREPRRGWLPIESPIDGALRIVARQLQNADVVVERVFNSSPHDVHIDAGQLEQVFVNLFINASHAMPSGGTLHVETRYLPSDAGPGEVLVRVSDTGLGIAPECLPRVFEPFFTTKGRLGGSDTPGTGLGLSVSHGIIQAHGGQITVQSTVGVGTTFELRFAVPDAGVPLDPPPPLGELATPSPAARVSARILVVDDEADVCGLVRDCLAGHGYEVEGVGNTHEALALVDSGQFDLIISDLLMPGGGGKAILQAALELPTPPPVIVMTGRIEEHLEAQIMESGAAACLSKPFRVVDLRDAVARLLKRGQEPPPEE